MLVARLITRDGLRRYTCQLCTRKQEYRGRGVRWYTSGTNVDKARSFLARYHEETLRKYPGSSKKEASFTSVPESNKSQIRVQPQFLAHAVHHNGRSYFCHTEKTGKRRLIRYKMKTSEEVILAEDMEVSCRVKEVIGSDAGTATVVLYSSDSFSAACIIEESTGKVLARLDSAHQVQWISDSQLFYTTISNNLRPDTVYFFDVNTGDKEECYRSTQEDCVLSVTRTKDHRYTIINSNTKLASEVFMLGNGEKVCSGAPVCSFAQGRKCYLEHHKNRLVALMSSSEDPNLAFYWSDVLDPTSVLPCTSAFTRHPGDLGVIHEMEVFERGIVLYSTPSTPAQSDRSCYWTVRLLDGDDYTVTSATIPFPEDISLVTPFQNTAYEQSHVKMKVHSLTKPAKQLNIPFSNFSVSRGRLITRGRYDLQRSYINSADTPIPVTTVGKEEVLDSPSPALFVVYGCYGESLDYVYEMLPFALLDAGWKLVLCHVRGGGERGREWYLKGMGSNKHTAVLDTLNCISHFHASDLTSPDTSVLQSCSAGAIVAMRTAQTVPGIVGKVVLRMPLLDLKSAILSGNEPLAREDRVEWGSDEGDFTRNIESLCPCSAKGSSLGSELYVTAALHDRRTPIWHTANYLHSAGLNKNQVYVNLLEDGDHVTGFGSEEDARETQFILDQRQRQTVWQRIRSRLF